MLFVSQLLSVNSNNLFTLPKRDRMLNASLWLLQRKLVAPACKAITDLGAFLLSRDKPEVHPLIGYEGPDVEYGYSSTLTYLGPVEGAGQRHSPAASSPGKIRYPFFRRLGEPQGRSGRVREISP